MLNVDGAAGKSGQKVDLGVVEQVVALALETGMRLLLNLELNVAGLDTRKLVALSPEVDLGTALDTLVDVDVQDLALDSRLLAVALLATVLVADALALAIAVGANSLEALDHGTHLTHHGLGTGAVASSASLDGTLLAAAAVTLGTDDRLLQSKLRDLALIDVLERDPVDVVDGACLLGSLFSHAATEHATHATKATAAAAEELGEQVFGASTTSHATRLETFLSIFVVDLALFGVGEDLVSVRELLELVFGFGAVCILV